MKYIRISDACKALKKPTPEHLAVHLGFTRAAGYWWRRAGVLFLPELSVNRLLQKHPRLKRLCVPDNVARKELRAAARRDNGAA